MRNFHKCRFYILVYRTSFNAIMAPNLRRKLFSCWLDTISISLMINHKQHVLKTLLEQANCTIKNKLSHKIEVIKNFERSEDSICLILTMNTQGYSSLLYNMTLYEGLFVASIEIRVIIQQSLLKSALGLLTVQMNQWTMLCKMDFSSLMK